MSLSALRWAGAATGLLISGPLAIVLGVMVHDFLGATHGQATVVAYVLMPFFVIALVTDVLLLATWSGSLRFCRAAGSLQLLVGIGLAAVFNSLLWSGVCFVASAVSCVLLWISARRAALVRQSLDA